MTAFWITQHINKDLEYFLPVISKYTISVPCLSNHAPWQQIHKVTSAQSTVIYMSKFYRQKLVTNAHLEMGHCLKCHISRWNMVSQALACCDEPTPGCADIWPRLRNRRDSISVTILRVRSKFFRRIWQNSPHDFHLEGSWSIGAHFRWPCLSDFLCMVGGSSDLCRLCQFLWDSTEHTTLSRNMRPDSGRRFPLVYMCVLVNQNRKRVISGTQALEVVSLLHLWSMSTHFK